MRKYNINHHLKVIEIDCIYLITIIMSGMRAVIQRVLKASVTINNEVRSEIGAGLLVLVGIEVIDEDTDIDWLCGKIVHLRIFDDDKGVMNLSVLDTGGDILAISQIASK